MNELKDYQRILSDKATRAETFFAKYPDFDALAKNFADINADKIRKVEPEIMVYGIYNAGKSSILNELIGADKAKVADVPTTDAVTYYEWNGYRIADTPGIFAPIEHENVTQEHLKKADIVLFVMSNDGQYERKENYLRMKDIADAGKKVIIVLNDKDGMLGERDAALQNVKRKIAVNMKTVGIENVDEKYCIVTVNADLAHQGRLENEPLFIADSGLAELKSVILSELKRTTPFVLLRNGIAQLEEILTEFVDQLESRENSALLREMNRVLETFNKQKISMRRDINAFIDRQADTFGATLPQKIWDSRDSQDRINEVFGAEIERFNARVQQEIQRQIQDAATILELELKSFTEVKLDASTVDTASFGKILSRLDEVNASSSQALVAQNGESKVDSLTTGLTATFLTDGGAIIAKEVGKTALGKAITNSALGKILSSVVPAPFVPITVIVGGILLLKKLFGGDDDKELNAQVDAKNAAERRRVEAEMQARQELNQKCRYLAEELADDLKSAADLGIAETLALYEEPFKAEIAARKSETAQVADDILTLRELLNEYDLLRVELGAR